MVDDSMEIASEHGHNTAEEDIDIDIDLTTGNVDEDDILDDIDADADFDTNITDVPAHVETDDLMVDDDGDDASYHMEDADLLEEEADDHVMEQEPAVLSFATDEPSDTSFTELHATESNFVGTGISDQFWDEPQEQNEVLNAQDIEVNIHGSETVVDNSADSTKKSDSKDSKEFAPISFPHPPTDEDPQSNSPPNSNYDGTTQEELESNVNEPPNPNHDDTTQEELETDVNEPTKSIEATDSNIYAEDGEQLGLSTASAESAPIDLNSHTEGQEQEPEPEQEHPGLNTVSAESDLIDTNNSTLESTKDSEYQYHARGIVVKYNNRSYPLIRKSSTDHPNDFFFEDSSVVEKTLNEFCSEIRKVLAEENLPQDDKISLVIEELQLVIEETQLPSYPPDLSLCQIIRLYEQLVNNDGTGEIPPLNLRLVIQPTGPDRFLALSKGAAEGKGLLEFVTWDAESEDDPTEFGDQTEHYDSESSPDEYNTELEDGDKSKKTIDTHDENYDPGFNHDQPNQNVNSTISASAEIPQVEQEDRQGEVGNQESVSTTDRKSPETSEQANNETEEDGDFIDYEDEEDAEKPSGDGVLKSELPEANESRPHNEEEYPRTLVSNKKENGSDELDDQLGDETTHTDEVAQPKETFDDVGSDIDYEEENADNKFDGEEEDGAAPNDIENAENEIDLNATNDEDREYASYEDNNENEQHEDDKGLELADDRPEIPCDVNEIEQNGDSEGLDLADHTLEINNVEISYDDDVGDGQQQNFEGDEFDLGVDDEETAFLQNYQLDDDDTFNDNELLNMSVSEVISNTNATFDDTAAETDSATLSNASIAEPQATKLDLDNRQDQEDEIDYDEDENEENPPSLVVAPQPPTPKSNDSPISTSGKRPRADADFEDGDESNINEAKRIRS
ncbi:uncharacterized protein EAF02_006795 [Botrytis sinoallii]|uniref:uncharacterized protein n=1 Tax=Botrytis sinoallii TaxID=1463999 RepID=UPI001900290E|nr:uncharacterized protein EAF02_006795 [Botrytis sinoallii]KAF7880904.1 hypothetical protein EAF02_006795 [Botrytis sinoallii]